MNSITRKENALDRFHDGYNCAQSVLISFSNDLNLNQESALKIASGFGGGMGKLQNTCGAVSAAFMIIGYLHGKYNETDNEANEVTNNYIQDFAQKFTQVHGTLMCKSLIGFDLNNPKEAKQAVEADVFYKQCSEYLSTAVDILEDILPDF